MKFIYSAVFFLVVFTEEIFSLAAQTPDTTFYSMVTGKTIAGVQKRWKTGANEYHYFYQFNDRGRGSSITDDVTTDDGGWVLKFSTK